MSLSAAVPQLVLRSAPGRWVVLACVLGSGLAGIDATVVNIALPAIGQDLGVGVAGLQWSVTAYALTLAALLLLGGSLGDRFGRRRVFLIGVGWFAVASLLCALAPGIVWLVVARALQGAGGALLTPASLAIIQASFARGDRARAIGAWSALGGTASAIAPFLGGWLLEAGGWRLVFLVNPPIALLVIAVTLRHVPETRDPAAGHGVDVAGSAAGVIGLGGLTAGLIGLTDRGPGEVTVWLPLLVGVAGLAGLLVIERRARSPMVPPSLFRSRQFSAANAVTFLLYASISAALLLLVIGLQTVAGFTPLEAGTALLPITVVMLALASRAGAVAERIGPRIPMAVGPVICAVGLLLMLRLSTHSGYWLDVLPAVTVFGLGLAVFVAPLTATALGAVPSSRAGVASAVNNAVARAAGLIAIAALPALAGLTGDAYASPEGYLGPYRVAIAICAGLQVAGGVLAAVTIQNRQHRHDPDRVPSRSLALSGDSVVACSRAERDGADPPLVGA